MICPGHLLARNLAMGPDGTLGVPAMALAEPGQQPDRIFVALLGIRPCFRQIGDGKGRSGDILNLRRLAHLNAQVFAVARGADMPAPVIVRDGMVSHKGRAISYKDHSPFLYASAPCCCGNHAALCSRREVTHMKITKKTPLRQRGRSDERRQSAKDAIRDAYANGPQREVQIIPAKKDLAPEAEKRKLRVCAYCRVSTDEETQAGSYELQVQNYTKMIQENEEWEFAGIFADEGISGTSVNRREHFLEMIEKCKAGEIDLIITKQVSRFARNVLDSLNYIFMLRKLDPPVGVYFETEKLNTLDKSSDMVITVLSLVAQSESEQKSNSLKWSFKRRRAQGLGIYPNWSLLGYGLDEQKEWVIIEEEADVVRTIYNLYLEGYSSVQIADFLTKSGIPTVRGLPVWSSGGALGILKNEKYCGDALCQKTVTIDCLTHKSVKNNGLETQYFIEGHHAPIIEKRDWLLAQQIRKERRYTKNRRRTSKPRIVVKGPLAGFMIVDPKWTQEDAESILEKIQKTPDTDSTPLLEDGENFKIEKE